MKAILLVMECVPVNITKPDIPRLFPMILSALTLSDNNTRLTELSSIQEMMYENTGVIESHISSLTSALLSMINTQYSCNLVCLSF